MKTCYIAGKIGALPTTEYIGRFELAKDEVRALGYKPVSPLDLPHKHKRTWSAYMKEDIPAMLECNAVYALSNWRDSDGAIIEVNLALQVGIDIIHQQ